MDKKRGRELKPDYIASWGERIEGAYLGKDGRLRPHGKSTPAFGGKEEDAVFKYKRWKARQAGEDEPTYPEYAQQSILSMMAMDEERERIRKLILNDPPRAAVELRIPHLAYYPAVPDDPQFTLESLGTHFLENRRNENGRRLSSKYKQNTERAWKDFCKQVGARFARDIKREAIQAYHKAIMTQFDEDKSAAWVRTRFTAVKTILKYGLEYSRDKADYRRVLDECAILKAPSDHVNPSPISPGHFELLLQYAGVREKAMILLGANAAMHGGEVCAVRRAECDLAGGTLACRRSKNGYPRVAKLWNRTIKAVREYQKQNPHGSAYLFVSGTGTHMTGENFRQRIVAIRKRANEENQNGSDKQRAKRIPDEVTFEGVRDASFGAAEAVDPHHARFVAGHKTGMSDKYVLRQADNPKVIACCEAIEAYYFPPTGNGEEGSEASAGMRRLC